MWQDLLFINGINVQKLIFYVVGFFCFVLRQQSYFLFVLVVVQFMICSFSKDGLDYGDGLVLFVIVNWVCNLQVCSRRGSYVISGVVLSFVILNVLLVMIEFVVEDELVVDVLVFMLGFFIVVLVFVLVFFLVLILIFVVVLLVM